jgi:hypothetical protein
MSERNAFDEYMFGGGFEADAKKGVADAIAELIAAGIEPVNSSTLQKRLSIQNAKLHDSESQPDNSVDMANRISNEPT